MMPLSDMTPEKGLQSSEVRKRHHHQQFDDDNTFIPPALSAYGIALLNEKPTTSPRLQKQPKISEDHLMPQVTGIYEIDFADRINNNLKSKLSVHFKELSSPLMNGDSNSISNLNTQNHNNTSLHTSFNLSTNNHSTHDTTSDDILDNSLENHSFRSQPTSTSGSSVIRPGSSGMPRSRISRRFRSLGPPKRASEVNDENNDNNIKSPITPPQVSTFSPSAKKTPNSNSSSKFYRELERLKANTPDIKLNDLQFNKPFSEKAPPLIPNKPFPDSKPEVNHKFTTNHFSVFSDSINKKSPITKNSPLKRIPLNEKPINTVFTDNEQFRKPKPPAPSHKSPMRPSVTPDAASRQSPIVHQPPMTHKPPIVHQPSIISSSAIPSQSPPVSSDDSKKRKVITINGNQYEKLELLGRGGTSKVYKVKSLFNNKLYAIKKVTFDQFEDSCIQGFKGEIDLLLRLKHADRVVKLIDYAIGEGSICLVMECGDIDLAHVFQNKINSSTSLDLNFIRYHAIEVFKCVEAVHQADIVHSDLKPANFLFVRGILKIIDFGIANAVPDHTANIYRESQIGTPNYMAPEALTEVNQSLMAPDVAVGKSQTWRVGKPSDVWSCGCIIYQMIYGRPPYAGYSAQQRIMAIMNPQVKVQYPSKGLGGSKVPTSAIELMQKCLERNPNDRWTINECLNGDFLHPKIVSDAFVRDLVHLAVNFGHNNRNSIIHDDVYDKLCETVLKQINELNFA